MVAEKDMKIALTTSSIADDGVFGIEMYRSELETSDNIRKTTIEMLKKCKEWLMRFDEKINESALSRQGGLALKETPNENLIKNIQPQLAIENSLFDEEKRKEYIDILTRMINEEMKLEELKEKEPIINQLKNDLMKISDGLVGEKLLELENASIRYFE